MLQFSPNLIATADINPYAIVKMSTTAFSGSASTAAADYVVGVADGSTRRFDSSVHAAAGDPISLQPETFLCLWLLSQQRLIPSSGHTAFHPSSLCN